MKDLDKIINFCVEMDKLKTIYRQTPIITEDRYENDAEHSFHVALMAAMLSEYADREVNTCKVVQMLLVHDLVEVYAGDTYAYDEEAKKSQKEREMKAAEKVFCMLPQELGEKFKGLFLEFDEMKTDDALFANTIDRIQPMMLNFYGGGGSWREHHVPIEKIYKRLEPAKEISERLYNFGKSMVDSFYEKGLK